MKYEKPSVSVLASAAQVIQGTGGSVKTNQFIDAQTSALDSAGAYEADE